MPVFNSEKYICNSVESLLNQSYKNIEIIIIDDGSIDNSKAICEKLAIKDKRIKFYSRKNMGVYYTRNEAINKSKGKYIMFADSDDNFKENMVEYMVKAIDNNSLAICGYDRINEKNGNCTEKFISNEEFCINNYDKMIEKLQNNNLFNQVWNKIFWRKIICDNEIKFDESISLGEDFRFVLSYLNYCDKVNVISDILYIYTNSTTGLNKKPRNNVLDIKLSNSKELIYFFEKMKYPMYHAYHGYIKSYASGLKSLCYFKEKKEKKHLLDEFIKRAGSDELLRKISKYSKNNVDKIAVKIFLNKSEFLLKIIAIILEKIDCYNKKRLGY